MRGSFHSSVLISCADSGLPPLGEVAAAAVVALAGAAAAAGGASAGASSAEAQLVVRVLESRPAVCESNQQ
jgi:hypothetical protein